MSCATIFLFSVAHATVDKSALRDKLFQVLLGVAIGLWLYVGLMALVR